MIESDLSMLLVLDSLCFDHLLDAIVGMLLHHFLIQYIVEDVPILLNTYLRRAYIRALGIRPLRSISESDICWNAKNRTEVTIYDSEIRMNFSITVQNC